MKTTFLLTTTALLLVSGSILADNDAPKKPVKRRTTPVILPDPDNGGIRLASGFQALVFVDNLGRARHAAIDPATGTVFVKLDRLKDG